MPDQIYTPLWFMKILEFEPDPWQIEVLQTKRERILLNCCRQDEAAACPTTCTGRDHIESETNLPMQEARALHRKLLQLKSRGQSD